MQRTLDTNICSYILRRHPQAMLQRFAGLSASGLWLSAIVAAELRFGAHYYYDFNKPKKPQEAKKP